MVTTRRGNSSSTRRGNLSLEPQPVNGKLAKREAPRRRASSRTRSKSEHAKREATCSPRRRPRKAIEDAEDAETKIEPNGSRTHRKKVEAQESGERSLAPFQTGLRVLGRSCWSFWKVMLWLSLSVFFCALVYQTLEKQALNTNGRGFSLTSLPFSSYFRSDSDGYYINASELNATADCASESEESAESSNQSKVIVLKDVLLEDKKARTAAEAYEENYIGECVREGKMAVSLVTKNLDKVLESANNLVSKGLVMIANNVVRPTLLALLEEEYRFFASNLSQRRVAYKLFKSVENLPIICPYSLTSPEIFQPNVTTGLQAFGDPTEIFITSDKDVVRFLQQREGGLNILENLSRKNLTEDEHRQAWQLLADNFHLLLGTSSRMWIEQTLKSLFGIHEPLREESAQDIYSLLIYKLNSTDYSPHMLLKQFGMGMLSVSFPAAGNMSVIGNINEKSLLEGVKPTFMPDKLFNLKDPEWRANVKSLGEGTSVKIDSYSNFIKALEIRRKQFKDFGAVATFQETRVPKAELTALPEIEALFAAALSGRTNERDIQIFQSHMLMEMTRMSVEDGLVMQLHTGLERNYHKDQNSKAAGGGGAAEVDIPIAVDFSNGLQSLLNTYGNHPNLTLVLYTHDESTYGRELAPLAVQYRGVKLGSPLWFHESPEGIRSFLDSVVGSCGIINLAGYSDNSHHFLQIPSRHKIWRKVISDWVAKLVVEGRIEESDAFEMARQLAYTSVKRTYRM